MIRKIGLLAVCGVAAAIAYQKAGTANNLDCGRTEDSFKCVEFVENHDGDTFTVDIPRLPPIFGHHINVRIAHIDTAEINSTDACEKNSAEAARARLGSILRAAKRIDLVNIKRDKYFRILAEVVIENGTSVGDFILGQRLAVPYEGDTKPNTNWCLYPPNVSK